MTAARKKKLPSGRVRSVTPEAFAAFAQEVRGQFAEIGNQFKGFDARLVDLREHMDQRFDQVDARFGRVDEDLGRLKDASSKHTEQLKDIQRALPKKVDREEVEVIVEQVLARGGKR
jgi:hypothetical protein